MKNTLLLFAFMLFSTHSWAQGDINFDIHFTHSQEEYQSLEEFTNLTEGLGAWDYYDLEDIGFFELMNPLIMPGFEDRPMTHIEIDGYGGLFIEYFNGPDDPYGLSLVALAFEDFFFSPLNDSTNSDQGHILFHEGNGVVQIEFQNVAFEEEMYMGDGNLVSRANFQIELDYDELCVQIHFGSSVISPEIVEYLEEYLIVGTSFGWNYFEVIDGEFIWDNLNLVGIINGDPNMPDFDQFLVDPDFDEEEEGVEYLNSFPEAGNVYRFCYNQTTSVDDLLSKDSELTIYPNPATHTIRLEGAFGGEPKEVIIMDHLGRTVLRTHSGGDIDLSELPAGMYVVGVHYGEEEGYRYGKVVVE